MRPISPQQLKMHFQGAHAVRHHGLEKLILNIILCSFGILMFLYVLFLGNMIDNIMERKNLEALAYTLSSEVRDLELTYLSMSSNVDLDLSHSLGFKEIQTTFATHKSLSYKPHDL